MEPQDTETPVSPEPAARKPYGPPQLVVHGPIRDLTRISSDQAGSILPDS
jgi:hypothetical protein